MNRYDFVFTMRFSIGATGGFAGMMVCMYYGFAVAGGNGGLVVFSVVPFVCTLFFFGEYRLRPFREFRKGRRVSVPGWDWGRDIATAVIASAIGTGVWLGAVAVLLDPDMIQPTGATGIWVAAGALVAGTTYLLSWAVCKPLGLFPPPLKPGWGE